MANKGQTFTVLQVQTLTKLLGLSVVDIKFFLKLAHPQENEIKGLFRKECKMENELESNVPFMVELMAANDTDND